MSSRSFFQKFVHATSSLSSTRSSSQKLRDTKAEEAGINAAEYIAQMASELADISDSAKLDLVTYFLKRAQMEAEGFLQGKS